ncbi:MAG: DUF4129 domain-containing protein [Coriobacteriia bacterium]|nr:DUF4129 domain-containing protein [Coriobacteriia bacterium]
MQDYIKNSAADFAFTAVAAICLSYVALNGFYVSEALQQGPVPAVAALVCVAALFLVARNVRTARLGGLAFGACLLVSWIVGGALTPNAQVFTDNESNYLIFAMVVTLVPTGVFLLSRKLTGAMLLFVGGTFLGSLLQLLYWRNSVVWLVVFVAASLALIVFKNYQQALRTASTVREARMLPGFCVALAVGLVATGLGAGIWYGVVEPLGPSAVQIKLITEYRALETKLVVGTSDISQVPNVNMTSNKTNNGVRTTDDIKESPDGVPWGATGQEKDQDLQSKQDNFLGIDVDSLKETFDFQQNPSVAPLMLGVFLLIALLIAAFFLGRRALRKRRVEKLRALGPEQEFTGLFLYLLRKFKRLGITVPDGQTLTDFGRSSVAAMEPYSRESGVAFSDLAASYCAVAYGGGTLTSEEVQRMERFYGSFWKAARSQLGNIRYFFKSFVL